MSKRKCLSCGNLKSIQKSRSLCDGCRTFKLRIKNQEIREPDYPDVTTAAYKEPMEKVEGGFGYYGAITTTTDGKHIQCHICGYYFHHLTSHVIGKHKMSQRDYKTTYGLRLKDGLVSPVLRAELQDNYNKHVRPHANGYLKKAHAAVKKKIASGELKPGGNQWGAQTRNEKGNCREQTIAKIQDLARRNGGIATLNGFLDEYGQGQSSTIHTWFGSWTEALRAAGLTSARERLLMRQNSQRISVLRAIRKFYQEEGRTPETSDFNSRPEFPSQKAISLLFGNLNNARRLAGVPELCHIGHGRWVEVKQELVLKG